MILCSKNKLMAGLALVATLTGPQVPAQQVPLAGLPEKLGTVDFPISCKAEAQRHFTRGIALYHSYHWVESAKSFNAAAQAEPSCAMAYWGLSLIAMDNTFLWPLTGKALVEGMAQVEKAKAAGPATQRERDYVAASEAFFKDAEKIPARTRQLQYELSLEKMTRDHAKDIEAKILHAMVISANFDPNDKSYANQFKAADILERIHKDYPDHPGAVHYLIHTYDYPPLAQRGLTAALRYRDVAPAAPHALHMPSHIFTRLGHWQDSVASNQAVLRSTKGIRSVMHSMDYMAYAWMQTGQDANVEKLVRDILAMPKIDDLALATAYALAAIPARLVIERGRWAEAAQLKAFPDDLDYSWPSFPHANAVRVFSRGLGAARNGSAVAARQEASQLAKLKQDMLAAKLFYWAEQTDIQLKAVEAWALRAEGKNSVGLEMMKDAADHEDRTEKNVVTPGPIKPARELLAEMLMEVGQPAQALTEFEGVLKKEPNRLGATVGAARAAELTGDRTKARLHYTSTVRLLNVADAGRPELKMANDYLARP